MKPPLFHLARLSPRKLLGVQEHLPLTVRMLQAYDQHHQQRGHVRADPESPLVPARLDRRGQGAGRPGEDGRGQYHLRRQRVLPEYVPLQLWRTWDFFCFRIIERALMHDSGAVSSSSAIRVCKITSGIGG